MKTFLILFVSVFFFSFRPSTEKAESVTGNGFYIMVKDLTDHTNHKYLVQSKDSVNIIFDSFFNSELDLGNVDRPISIFNGKRDFYIARVTVFEKPNGEKGFKHLKYPPVYTNPNKLNRRSKLKPVVL